MADNGTQPSVGVSSKPTTVPRSLSPDSPLPQMPASSTVPCGGSVELQRLRSHVLPMSALSSSGSSSDDEPDISSPVEAAAPLHEAAPPQQCASMLDRVASAGETAADGPVGGTVVARQSAASGARDEPRSLVSGVSPAGDGTSAPNASEGSAGDQSATERPWIRHGGGALAGLLQSPDEPPGAETSADTAARFRQAMGLQHQSLDVQSDGAGSAHSAQGSAQYAAFASGKKCVGGWGHSGSTARKLPMSDGQAQQRREASDAPQNPSLAPLQQQKQQQGEDGGVDAIERDNMQHPSPAAVSAPVARRSVSTPASAGAATLPPSLPSLPQLRSARPGSSSFGAMNRSLSQSSSEHSGSPSQRITETVAEAAVEKALQNSAVAKAERRAARVRRRQLRETCRAGGDVSPDRDSFSPEPRPQQPSALHSDRPEVELVECLSSSRPASVAGSAALQAHAECEGPRQCRVGSDKGAAEPHVTRAASERGTPEFPGCARPSLDSGIELPEQTYPQMLERTIERLRRELYDSQQDNASLESSLHCKEQECESLTRLVRELTAARAKAASARHHLQERHHELLEDYGRQARVVEMTRQMQKDANLAVADAQHSAREAEDKCTLVRRIALQLQERSRALAAENASLRSQVKSLERVAMMQYGGGGQSACMAAYNQLRCAETY